MELAERCERSKGPDRELDCLIWCAANGIEPEWTGENGLVLVAGKEGAIGWVGHIDQRRCFRTNRPEIGFAAAIPAYTKSLDAAVSLLPAHDWEYSLEWQAGSVPWSEEPAMIAIVKIGDEMLRMEAEAASPALAMTAAAMIVRGRYR